MVSKRKRATRYRYEEEKVEKKEKEEKEEEEDAHESSTVDTFMSVCIVRAKKRIHKFDEITLKTQIVAHLPDMSPDFKRKDEILKKSPQR